MSEPRSPRAQYTEQGECIHVEVEPRNGQWQCTGCDLSWRSLEERNVAMRNVMEGKK